MSERLITVPDKLIVATTNKGKLREFAHRFAALGIVLSSLADYPDFPPIIEDGDTFEANAEIKARAVAERLGVPAIADDSGLAVDALGGEPGVYSARYAGEHATDEENIRKLLDRLHALPADRVGLTVNFAVPAGVRVLSPARFECALCAVEPRSGNILRARGTCAGYIIDTPRGTGGFGYDPVFYLPELGRTMAELSVEEKQRISHRGQALDQLKSLLSV